MAEDSQPGRRGHQLAGAVLLAIAIPILYVLSAGPAAFIAIKSDGRYVSFRVFDTFYAPVGWLDKNTFFHAPLDWYLRVWIP